MSKLALASLFVTLISLFNVAGSFSQNTKVISATGKRVDIRIGNELRKSDWNISPGIKPDVYDVYLPKAGKPVTFITDEDSILFDVKPGDYYEFVVLLNGKDSAFTAIKGHLDVPRAQFFDDYKKSHTGKTFVEIPEVYELMNVVMAITSEGKKDNGLIRKNNAYYSDVLKWFDQYRDEPIVGTVNAEISNHDNYHALKMDAYAFEFHNEKIVQSATYDRIGFSNTNNLRSFIPALQDFAVKTKFADFYAKHKSYYDGLIISYRDSIGVPEMQKWLTANFPSARYDSFKIIFSPLVSQNQSAARFDLDGFKEAQAHVNFPFNEKNNTRTLSKKASLVQDGSIIFTELNHAFIDLESAKPQYTERIAKAFANLATWNNPEKPAKYYNDPFASFNEYMNWALVCLRYADYAPENEQDQLIQQTEEMMVNSRGFVKFAEFDQFLVKLYKNRKKGQVLADLYPEIVGWFEENK
ncbi:DUF4932 domain-containing protein [Dyadobacter pollutisoli]|uniref:DUF4932 domain-containing protein n=1 Tax=Dyadobacter pollutisoli TaxID=2910158 RepID=A0A9E8SNZ6_9BACT|nr:DUF4932 domain-containing protein [Dyadobacter pollutisoli]WAC14206.1 DUF4932 domain-containing protein [Dyadobacter pollutisoli]